MKRQVLTCALTVALGLGLGESAFATVSGPLMAPLKVTQIYMKGGNGTIYVAFQAGAMPGCYQGMGGYLYPGNTFYKEIYAQLMLMVANGGTRAQVLYTQNASDIQWSDCTIDGIYLQPE
jgi:hypothetical protein